MTAGDPYDLNRFVHAQADVYAQALAELQAGRKRTHWMWFIFPQLAGLGSSPMAMRYAIQGKDEAYAYLAHPMLGARLHECADEVLKVEGGSAHDIFGSPDDLKLHSCATLFAAVSTEGSVFHRLLENYFHGEPDSKTLRLLGPGAAR